MKDDPTVRRSGSPDAEKTAPFLSLNRKTVRRFIPCLILILWHFRTSAADPDTAKLPEPYNGASLATYAQLVHPSLKSADSEVEISEEIYHLGSIADYRVIGAKKSTQLQLLFWMEPKKQAAADSVIYSLGVYAWRRGRPALVYAVADAAFNSTADERDAAFDPMDFELLPGKRALAIRSYRRHRSEYTTLSLFWPRGGELRKIFSQSVYHSNQFNLKVDEATLTVIPKAGQMADIRIVTTERPEADVGEERTTTTIWKWDKRNGVYSDPAGRRTPD